MFISAKDSLSKAMKNPKPETAQQMFESVKKLTAKKPKKQPRKDYGKNPDGSPFLRTQINPVPLGRTGLPLHSKEESARKQKLMQSRWDKNVATGNVPKVEDWDEAAGKFKTKAKIAKQALPKLKSVTKSVLTTEDREDLKQKQFALPKKADDKQEKAESGNYPIPDLSHARNALAMVAQHGTPAEQSKVRAAVYKKYPELDKRKEEGQEKSIFISAKDSLSKAIQRYYPWSPMESMGWRDMTTSQATPMRVTGPVEKPRLKYGSSGPGGSGPMTDVVTETPARDKPPKKKKKVTSPKKHAGKAASTWGRLKGFGGISVGEDVQLSPKKGQRSAGTRMGDIMEVTNKAAADKKAAAATKKAAATKRAEEDEAVAVRNLPTVKSMFISAKDSLSKATPKQVYDAQQAREKEYEGAVASVKQPKATPLKGMTMVANKQGKVASTTHHGAGEEGEDVTDIHEGSNIKVKQPKATPLKGMTMVANDKGKVVSTTHHDGGGVATVKNPPVKMKKSLDPALAARMNMQPMSVPGAMGHPEVGQVGFYNTTIAANFVSGANITMEERAFPVLKRPIR